MNGTKISVLLEELGLTEYESKTLSTLFNLKESEAPEVSRTAQVPKTRVYDVLDKLIERGLIIEISGRPKRYRVIEPSEAINTLLKSKKTEINMLEERAAKLKDYVSDLGGEAEKSGEKVMRVKDKRDFNKILSQELEKAEKQVLAFTSLNDDTTHIESAVKNARKKNVSFKIVNQFPNEAVKRLSKHGVEMRHMPHGLDAYLIDEKKVILALSNFKEEKPEYHFMIWNNNNALNSALGHYFDKIWKEGKQL